MMTFPAANAIYRRETYDNYPAARAILQVVYEGLQLPMDRALARRVALLRQDPALAGSGGDDPLAVRLDAGAQQGRAAAGATCRRRRSRRSASSARASWAPASPTVSAQAGIEVVLIDRDQESADKGKAHSQKRLTDQVNKRPRHARPSATRCSRASRRPPTTRALAGVDLVIEAVFEDRKVKAEATAKAQAVVAAT